MTAIRGVHPYADKFPMLPDTELAELAESIRTNGLRQPVVLTPDGLILDGRNRTKACEIAGVEPHTTVYDGDDLAEFVIDSNTARRHMSTGARAMATALVLAADNRRTDGRWKRGSVDIVESHNSDGWNWRDALKRCGMILDHAPEVAEAVVNGELALDAAHRLAQDRRQAVERKAAEEAAREADEQKAREFIESTDPDLAERVDGEDLLTYVEALDLWKRRNREEAERIAKEKANKERAERDHANAMTDLYSGVARGLQICGGYGGYDDIGQLMSNFSTDYLHPPQYIREFSAENLGRARRFIDWLITWQEANNV